MDGKKFDKNTLKTLVIAASLLLNCILGGASYTYYHHLAEQMNETASLQSQVSHLEGSVSDLQAQVDESQPAIDGLKAQVASLTEEKNGLQSQVDTLTSQKADLQCIERLLVRLEFGQFVERRQFCVRPGGLQQLG